MNIPLIITSAITPEAPFVAISDVNQRLLLTFNSIKKWRLLYPNLKIILCDGSNYKFDLDNEKSFFEKMGEIEILSFKNNYENVKKFGKGYGEGEIIAYALENSIYLKGADNFAKCTSKLWVTNLQNLIDKYNGKLNIYKNYNSTFSIKLRQCDTRFYIVNKNLYKKYFLNIHENVNDYSGIYLEHCFANAIKINKLGLTNFDNKPLINGYSGSTGSIYLPKADIKIKEFLIFIKEILWNIINKINRRCS